MTTNYAETAARSLGVKIDDLLILQPTSTDVLMAVARGEVDLNRLAREELAARGLDQSGVWVGFPKAAAIARRALVPADVLAEIARRRCSMELAERGRDSLDFADVHCSALRAALEDAYAAGAAARSEPTTVVRADGRRVRVSIPTK